jgi:hypothetical protein
VTAAAWTSPHNEINTEDDDDEREERENEDGALFRALEKDNLDSAGKDERCRDERHQEDVVTPAAAELDSHLARLPLGDVSHHRGESLCAPPPNGPRLSCGALKKDSFPNLRAPAASSAC